MKLVRLAYLEHHANRDSTPIQAVLRFSGNPRNRIIAKPAYLSCPDAIAGVKWVASFPGNIETGIPRASAVLVLNCAITGRVVAIMDGTAINLKRTAASAVLAIQLLANDDSGPVGLFGCGLLNAEVVRFLVAAVSTPREFLLFDQHEERAIAFRRECQAVFPGMEFSVVDRHTVLANCSLVSLATTALAPHIDSIKSCRPGTLFLHLSLRDFVASAILGADNVVDDPEHVCSSETSLHLAERITGSRSFIRCTLGDILAGAPARPNSKDILVFSPFGLGVLDLAVGAHVQRLALERGLGIVVPSFSA